MLTRKEQILEVALELFNAQGSANVSTRHIAEAMAISPGNLYYHYPHKEAIILALLERSIVEFEVVYRFDFEAIPPRSDFLQELHGYLKRYRFLHADLALLCFNDSAFKARFEEIWKQRAGEIERVLKAMERAGFLRAIEEKNQKGIIQTISMLTHAKAALEGLEEGNLAEMIEAILKPHMTREGIAWLLS